MRKNKKIVVITLSVLLVAMTATFGVLYAFVWRVPSAEQIFQNSMDFVVEVKAQNSEESQAFGTAVLVSNKGEFLTNAHVVTYRSLGVKHEYLEYHIRFCFETDYRQVELTRYNAELDVAVIKLKEMPSFELKPAKIGDSTKLKSGQTVYAVGNSQNYGISISQGLIGIPIIEIEYDELTRRVIQCDLTITEGNSGGALLDNRGRLIGLTTFRIRDQKGNPVYGIAYCVPINTAIEFYEAQY